PEQTAVAAAKVQDAPRCRRHAVEQDRLAFRSVRDRIGLLQVVERVLGRGPKVDMGRSVHCVVTACLYRDECSLTNWRSQWLCFPQSRPKPRRKGLRLALFSRPFLIN